MRVTGGEWRGHVLKVPPGRQVRPTSDRVKLALFNALGPRVAGSRVLDLFAGTGGLGIEALSRGARQALFVEADPRVAAVLRENLRKVGAAPRAEVWRQDVFSAIAKLAGGSRRFELILADPPYRQGLAGRLLPALAAAGVLAPGGVLVIEHDPREDLPDQVAGLARVRNRRYGDTCLSFYESAVAWGSTSAGENVAAPEGAAAGAGPSRHPRAKAGAAAGGRQGAAAPAGAGGRSAGDERSGPPPAPEAHGEGQVLAAGQPQDARMVGRGRP